MNLTFEADVGGQPKPVQMRFGNESDLAELRRWRSPAKLAANPHVSDALEYARLASKRWAYYYQNGETVTSFQNCTRPFKKTHKGKLLLC
jgi:hypothetical protein